MCFYTVFAIIVWGYFSRGLAVPEGQLSRGDYQGVVVLEVVVRG
jgi:hypothetical protein